MENIASLCGDTLGNALTSCWRRFGQRLMVIRDPLGNAKIVLETLCASFQNFQLRLSGNGQKSGVLLGAFLACLVSNCSEWLHNEKNPQKSI
jgi:hypothetical protein